MFELLLLSGGDRRVSGVRRLGALSVPRVAPRVGVAKGRRLIPSALQRCVWIDWTGFLSDDELTGDQRHQILKKRTIQRLETTARSLFFFFFFNYLTKKNLRRFFVSLRL